MRDVIELARSHTADAIKTLVAAMNSDTAPWAARIAAAREILDRGWDRPRETHEIDVRPKTLEELILQSYKDEPLLLESGQVD